MEYYRRQPPGIPQLLNPETAATEAVDSAGRMLRRLLPFPSADTSSLPLMGVRKNLISQSIVPDVVSPAAGRQADTIVSQAAAILDEEMAKGVLAARGSKPFPSHRDADRTSTVLRQVHDVIDNIARIWPTVQSASPQWPGASAAATNIAVDEALPTLKPASVLRPGERCTISMVLHNEDDRAVRLTPLSTDLIGSTGARISCQLFEFVPGDMTLEPGEQRELQIQFVVPAESALGCYVGLLVATGVDYLRALIAIEVG